MEDFRWEDQACSQANTAAAWISDLSLIYSRVTDLFRAVSVLAIPVCAMPHVKVTWKVGRVVVPFLVVRPGEKESTRSWNLCTGNTQRLGVTLQGFCLIGILASLNRPAGVCSVFVVLTPCDCGFLQPSVCPYCALRINKVLIPFFCIIFACQWGYRTPPFFHCTHHGIFSKPGFPGWSELQLSSTSLEWIPVHSLGTFREMN